MVEPRISPLRPSAERSHKRDTKSLGMVLCCCFGVLLLWGGVEASQQQTAATKEEVARVRSPEASSRLRTDGTVFEAKRYSGGAAAPAAASASQEQQRHQQQQQQQTQLPQRRRRLQAGSGSRLGSGDTLSERRDGDVHSEGSSEQGGETRSLDTHIVEGEGDTDPAETAQQVSPDFKQGETHETEGLEDSSELDSSSGISKNVLVIVFCAVAFIANGGFLVYVFWVM